ncbi:MAG: pyrroloquinoline quinone-dependent dehydrogenase [Pseudohongiellaceae bacterium]
MLPKQFKPVTQVILIANLLFCHSVLGQNSVESSSLLENYSSVTPSMLTEPSANDWLMWRRSYDVGGHTPLDQVDISNVENLELAWSLPLGQGGNMTTPLVHDGVMFIADTGNMLRVLDAKSGAELWNYQHESDNLDGRRIGISLHGDQVIVPHNDLTLVALEVRTGEVKWMHKIQTPVDIITGGGYYSLRSAPVIAGNTLMQGVGATMVPEGGFIVGIDLSNGQEKWRFHTVARPEDPVGGHTWNNLSLAARSGGSVWIPGSYDAELDLAYFGTAPTYDTAPLLPDLDSEGVSNAALYTNTTLAIRPESGELIWHFQHMPNDQWDLDWVYERHITTLEINGEPRKVVFTAGKMALYDILDAATGKYINSIDTGVQNLVADIDSVTGEKILFPHATPNRETSHLVCPYALGGRNWQAASFDDSSNMLFLPLSEMCMMADPGEGGLLTTGVQLSPQPRPDSDGNYGRLQAINMNTLELAWTHRELTPPATPALSTAGGLVFTGFLDQSFKALNAETGAVLWQDSIEHIPSSFPISYAVDDKQYIAIIRGQPSRFTGSLYGIISGFLGENSAAIGVPSAEAAILVYALP